MGVPSFYRWLTERYPRTVEHLRQPCGSSPDAHAAERWDVSLWQVGEYIYELGSKHGKRVQSNMGTPEWNGYPIYSPRHCLIATAGCSLPYNRENSRRSAVRFLSRSDVTLRHATMSTGRGGLKLQGST